MKKLYTLIAYAFIGFTGNAQVISFSDANFKARLLLADTDTNWYAKDLNDQYLKIDANNNGEIEQSEAAQVSYLNLSNSGLLSTDGLQYFYNIKVLEISYIPMTAIDVTFLSNLRELTCTNNSQLASLNLTGLVNLKKIWCMDDQLTSLDLSTLTQLTEISCNNNQLTSINTTGLTNLKILVCGNNQLTGLDLSSLNQLTHLYCEINQFTALNLSNLNELKALNCNNNQLTTLNAGNLSQLESLSCQENQLTSVQLPNSSTNFHYFYCYGNLLTSLNLNGFSELMDVYCQNNLLTTLEIDNSPYLNYLDCSFNQLTTLDLSNSTLYLQVLQCQNNNLNSLFIKNNMNEYTLDFSNNPNLEYICADAFQLATIQNKITEYGYANCHANDYCSFTPGGTFYTIQGTTRYDGNSNGCDINDNGLPYPKFTFSNGTQTGNLIGDATGNYRYDVQAGTYTMTPVFENQNYFSISPSTVNVTFPNAGSVVQQNFCITNNGTHHDLEIAVIPVNTALPGFDSWYKIVYKNKGTHTQSGTVSLSYDDSVLDFVTAAPTFASQASNTLIWNFSNLLPFESREVLVTFNINSPQEVPPVNNGDVLTFTGTVNGLADETPDDNTLILHQTVLNSFDPNDKTCLEGTSIAPNMAGEYVHYVIRFENTGTFPAQNIVVKDIIDTNKFDISTLIPLTASHAFVTRITNINQVEFIFENINLPFDNATNDGYVAFKIKTKPTLQVGDTFSNSANIYFDYNFPIVTNTATTTIQTLGNTDLALNNAFTVWPVPAKNVISITNKESLVIRSVGIYNTLGQLVQVHANPSESIDVSGLRSGSYFIKITCDSGSAISTFIKE